MLFVLFKQKTAYEMRISDWSSDVCSSDLATDSTAAAVTEGGTPPEVDGTPVPALADGDAVEPIGDAPIGDSELAAPLPPLGSFDVEPVQFAEPEDEGRNRTIQ